MCDMKLFHNSGINVVIRSGRIDGDGGNNFKRNVFESCW